MKLLDFVNSKLIAASFFIASTPLIIPVKAFALDEVDLVPCSKDAANNFGNICPVDKDASAVGGIIRNIIIGVLIISAIVALLFLIWGGFKWITSGGDKAKVDAARQTIIAAIIGLIIAFLAYFILSVVLGLFGIEFGNLQIPDLTG